MITEELKQALGKIQVLGTEDLNALAKWFRGQGRDELRARGASDDQIGAFRVEIDREGEGSMSSG